MSTSNRRGRSTSVVSVLMVTAVLLPMRAVHADPVSVINALRLQGCGRQPAVGTRLQSDGALDDVARELASSRRLQDAIELAQYPAASTTSFHVRGSPADDDIRRVLTARYCAAINDARYEGIGVFQRDDETWIVLGVRQASPPPPPEPTAAAQRVLALVNAARAEARTCGREQYAATGPLTLSAVLTQAALVHAQDMAERGSLAHRGSDGSESGDRITRAGYQWQASGENLAAGQRDADAVVAAWLESAGHCATLMGPHFTEMGVAFALAPEKDPAIYWAQVFAAPR